MSGRPGRDAPGDHTIAVVSLADLIEQLVGPDVPVAFEAYDGSRLGPTDAAATLVIRSPHALQRLLTAPRELGFGRAYVAGESAGPRRLPS